MLVEALSGTRALFLPVTYTRYLADNQHTATHAASGSRKGKGVSLEQSYTDGEVVDSSAGDPSGGGYDSDATERGGNDQGDPDLEAAKAASRAHVFRYDSGTDASSSSAAYGKSKADT